jgi:predicted transcriptional regulator
LDKLHVNAAAIIQDGYALEARWHAKLTYLERMTNLLQAYLVMTSADCGLVSFKPNDDCQMAFSKMDSSNIDYAPVLKNGVLVGYVKRCDLVNSKGKICKRIVRQVTAKNRVSLESSLETVLKQLTKEPFLFVMENNHLRGIITRADVNKRAFRTLFYILLSELESLLVNLIRNRLPCDKNLQLLSEDRAKDVLYNFWKAKAANVETYIEQYLSFSDILNVVLKSNDTTSWLWLGFKSKDELKTMVSLIDFRNCVMHSTRSLLDREDPIASIDRCYTQLWELIENLLETESLDENALLSVDFSRKGQDFRFILKSGAIVRTSLSDLEGKELEELGIEKLRKFLTSSNLRKRSNKKAIRQLEKAMVFVKLLAF